jgi:minor tail protein
MLGTRTIIIKFLGDTKDLKKAGDDGTTAIGKWKTAFGKLDRVASGVLLGLGGAIAGAVTSMVNAGDEIGAAASRMGIGTTALQEMQYWATQNEIELGDLERQVGTLNTRIGEAIRGNESYADAFESLDIALTDSQGNVRSTEDVFKDTIRALRDIEDPALQAGAAADIFGSRMARGLLPALTDSSISLDEAAQRAHDLGAVMDEEAVAAAAEMDEAFNDLKIVGTGLIRDFALPFLEVLRDNILPVVRDHVVPAVRSFGDWIRENKTLFVILTSILLALAVAIKLVAIAQALANLAFLFSPIGLVVLAIIALIAVVVLIIKHWDTVRHAFEVAWQWIWDKLKAFGAWFMDVFWTNGLKKVFDLQAAALTWIRDRFVAAFTRAQEIAGNAVDFIGDLPGRIRSGFTGLFNILTAPFRTAFNFISDAWNNTIGQLSWTVPSWVPGVGGNSISAPHLPRFHRGGTVPGMPGEEVLIIAEAGEEITPADEVGHDDGPTEIVIPIDLGEGIERVFRAKLSRSNRGLKRAALAGSGASA